MSGTVTSVLVGLRYREQYRHSLSLGLLKSYADSLPGLRGRARTVLLERKADTPHERLLADILAESPAVVGFSCYLWNLEAALAAAAALKKALPEVLIVLGGPEAFPKAEALLTENPAVDLIVLGEGELTYAELLERLCAGASGTEALEGLAGTLSRRGGGTLRGPERPLIQDLSILPSPYLDGTFKVRTGDQLVLETSRGCPLHCRFCDWQNHQPRRWFPASRALAEVARVAEQASGIYYFVSDSDMFADKARAMQLLAGFEKATGPRSTHWHFQTTLARIDEDLARLLDSAKFSLGAGVETIQPAALRRMRRGFDRARTEKAVAAIKRFAPKLSLHIQLIHGLPDDTLGGYRDSLEWALSCRPDVLFLPRALALPGAEFGQDPAAFGIVSEPGPPYRILSTETFPAEDLREADLLAFRVLSLHRVGPIRRALEALEGPGCGARRTALFERLWGRFEAAREREGGYAAGTPLAQIMEQYGFDWTRLDARVRLRALAETGRLVEETLAADGRTPEWPAVRAFLRAMEAEVLWGELAGTEAFKRLLGGLLGEIPMDSSQVHWVGWEGVPSEWSLCHNASKTHMVSTLHYDYFEVCPVRSGQHLHLEDLGEPRAWEKLFSGSRRATLAVVLSNIYAAIPPEQRVPLLKRIREWTHSLGRLLLWVDDAGRPSLERRGPGSGRDWPVPDADSVRKDLLEAGWTLEREPRRLASSGPFGGAVTWTLFSALPGRGQRDARAAERIGAFAHEEPCVYPTLKCDQACLYCSSEGEGREQTMEEVAALARRGGPTFSIEGGEPTLLLRKGLPELAAAARAAGTREVVLCTNGAALEDPESVRLLLESGVTEFNVNFPAHTEALFDALTGTKGKFPRRMAAVANILAEAGPERTRLNFVITALNAPHAEDFVAAMKSALPGLRKVSFNLVKVLGRVRADPTLVPRLSAAAPVLRRALEKARALGMEAFVDGVPLCHLSGFEDRAVDAQKLPGGDWAHGHEKGEVPACRRCRRRGSCAGPREDYVELYGAAEFRAVA